MKIKRVVLTDFRSYTRLNWTPERSIAVLTGENGAGKTNLLEAVSLLAPGRGLRNALPRQLARHGATRWGVAGTIEKSGDVLDLGTGIAPENSSRRLFQINEQSVRTQGEVAQVFSAVWLTPQMDRLFLEAGSGRRRFLDRLVVALEPGHAREVAAHDQALSQRNRLLAERPHEHAWLSAIEDSLARHAVAVTAARLALIDAMNDLSLDLHGFPRSDLALECAISNFLKEMSALDTEDRLRSALAEARSTDRARGSASLGAQRANLLLRDRQSQRSAEYSSSGQQKAMLVGVILSHARLVTVQRGDAPVLLLDEPLIHLDEERRRALLYALNEIDGPVFLTGTETRPFSALRGHADFCHISDGQLLRDCS